MAVCPSGKDSDCNPEIGGSIPHAVFMEEQNKIDEKLKNLIKQSRKLNSEIKRLQKLKKQNQSTEKINWKIISFQQRIYLKIWEWASPYSTDSKIALDTVVTYITNLPNNPKKVAASLEEIKKLQKLPKEVAIKKARSYINNVRNARNKRW